MERAEYAHQAAAERHEESARIHELTANSYQRAALDGVDGPSQVLRHKADQHWRAAHDSHLHSAEHRAKAEGSEQSSKAFGRPIG
jgi:hypothetical protein